MQKFTLKIIEIREETDDTVTLCFKQPGLKKIEYRAGQYLTLIFRINGRRYIRPYSLSSAPIVDNFLEVTIKRVLNGIVSNYIHDVLKVGDMIETMCPMGNFTLSDIRDDKTIILWGAGSGITPLISIAKYSLFTQPDVKVSLVYGNRNKENTIFNQAIQNLHDKYHDNFKFYHFHTQLKLDNSLLNIVKGRINPKKVLEEMNQETIKSSLHFICGPSALKISIKQVLKEMGIDENKIFFEDFKLDKNTKDFEDIKTRTVNLKFNEIENKLIVTKGKSILEVALDSGLEVPYSCQTGSCDTCKANLKKGAVRMIGIKKNRNDLAEDEFLLCCSYPLNNEVCLEI